MGLPNVGRASYYPRRLGGWEGGDAHQDDEFFFFFWNCEGAWRSFRRRPQFRTRAPTKREMKVGTKTAFGQKVGGDGNKKGRKRNLPFCQGQRFLLLPLLFERFPFSEVLLLSFSCTIPRPSPLPHFFFERGCSSHERKHKKVTSEEVPLSSRTCCKDVH